MNGKRIIAAAAAALCLGIIGGADVIPTAQAAEIEAMQQGRPAIVRPSAALWHGSGRAGCVT